MKKTIVVALCLCLVLSCIAPATMAAAEDKLRIVSTIFPPYDFVRNIAGERVELSMLLPPGSESHSFEPSPQDIIKIQNADVFIYIGGETDKWVNRILDSMDTSNMLILSLLDMVETVEEELVEGMEDDGHGHGEIDPENVKDRPLADFDGEWISGIPLIGDGSLDAYIQMKAEESERTHDEQKAFLLERWASANDFVTVDGDKLVVNGVAAAYAYRGYRVVESDHGVSVWYQFEIEGAVDGMPAYLMFNDHCDGNEHEHEDEHEEIAHMHLKYGDESFDALLADGAPSPFYFDATHTGEEIGAFMAGDSHEEEAEHDEHVWTSPKNAKLIVQALADTLAGLDPANAGEYSANAAAYAQKLDELDAAFRDVTQNAARKTLLFGDRFPFRYFADEYGLSYYAAFPGCATETEASAATIAFLIDKVRDEQLPAVFQIEFSNGKIAGAIAESTDAKRLEMHSGHNLSKKDFEAGVTYLDLMWKNLEQLKEALQ